MVQDPNTPEMQKVLNDILRSCQLVAGDIYDLIDQVCQNDVWSDDQITQIDALIETSKQSKDVKQVIQVLTTLLSIIDDVIVDKKARLSFRNRQKKILVSAILKKHELYIREQFDTQAQADDHTTTKEDIHLDESSHEAEQHEDSKVEEEQDAAASEDKV